MPLNANQKTVIVSNLKIILDNLLSRLNDDADVAKTIVLKTLRSKSKLAIRDFEDEIEDIKDDDKENPLAEAVENYLDGIHDVVNGNIEGLGAQIDDEAVDEYARHVIAVYFIGAKPDANQSAFRRHGYQIVLGVEDGFKGAWNTVRHPLKTGGNFIDAVWNYDKTYANVKKFAGQNRLRFFSGLVTGVAFGAGSSYAVGRLAGAAVAATEAIAEFEAVVETALCVAAAAENTAGITSNNVNQAEDYHEFFERPRRHHQKSK